MGLMFCQKSINCYIVCSPIDLPVYDMNSVFDSLLVNQLKSTLDNFLHKTLLRTTYCEIRMLINQSLLNHLLQM